MPNPLEYYGWVFSFTSFFAGPAFELREYLNTTTRTAAEQAMLPSRAATVILKFAQGVSESRTTQALWSLSDCSVAMQIPTSNSRVHVRRQYPLFATR